MSCVLQAPATKVAALISIRHKVDGFSVYLVLLLGNCAAMVVSFGVYVQTEKRIDTANQLRERSHRVTDTLRQSSFDRSSMARAYVVDRS
jgi:hypothetical protein